MINDHLSLSQQGLALLKSIETLRLKPYDDQTGQPIAEWMPGASIGYGYLIAEVDWPKFANGIDKSRAAALLEKSTTSAKYAIHHAVVVPLTQQEFDALVLLVFNIGVGAFRKSSVLKLINDPRAVTDYPDLESAWKAWNKSQGEINEGLENRRDCEWKIWQRGIYQRW